MNLFKKINVKDISNISIKEYNRAIAKHRKELKNRDKTELILVKKLNDKDHEIAYLKEHIEKLEKFTTDEMIEHQINKLVHKQEPINYEEDYR